MADRIERVSTITVSPHRMVAYVGETVTFVAMGSDIRGEIVHGAKFTWESSDTNKLTIDEAGRAATLRPGRVIVTARAGFAEKTAAVLIRPTRRPVQSDSEWQADQESIVSSTGEQTGVEGVLASLMDRLAPTAYAQGGGQGADYPNATWPGHVGTPPFAALEETRLGPVMPGSNFELPIPLVDLGGRGLATSLMAYYNSSVWGAYFDPIRNTTVYVFDPIQTWPSPGFSLGFGRVIFYDYSYYDGVGLGYKYMLIDPNGTRHALGIGTPTGNNVLQTTDGSHITYVGDVMSGTLHYNDGTAVTISKVNNRLLPTQITDTNGNYIQVAYKWETNFAPMAINYIVDTLGRVISFNYGEWPAPPGSTRLTSINGPTGGVTFNYQTVTMSHNFQNEIIVENAPASFSGISTITSFGKPTYGFSYSGYGMIYNIVATSAGGTATVTYNYPLGGEELFGGPTFTQRTESPNAVYSYPSWGEITRPDGTKLSLFSDVRALKNSSNQTLSKTEYTYTTDPGGSPAVQSVITTDEIGQQTKVDFDYDSYGNVVNTREYGFKISGQWQVRRRTHYTYLNWEPYISAYIRNRVTEVDVYDALQNTYDPDDVLVGKTVYWYDNSMGGVENYGGTASPPGHLSNYGPSGNLTNVTSYRDVVAGTSVTHNSKIDIFGNTTVAQVDCCNQKSFTMTEATYWSRASQTTTGNTSGIYLTTSAGYDFNTLAATSQTDPNNQTTSYSYDSAQRPTGFTSPTGANGSTSYNAWGEPTSSATNYSEGGVNKTITTSAVYNGWGQMTSSVDANGARTNYTYNNMGRMITATNPFPQGGTPGPVSTYQYDLLGRVTMVTLPGGNTVQTTYTSSSIVTVKDQVNRKIKRETDGLGRLIKVTEQDVSTGALTQETNYTYDIADRLTLVNQGNQTRAFKYDAEGRLLFERIPEMTATINDGTGTYWTCKYTYTDWGAVATKQDARGVITTHGYDTLHRLISISYNTSGAPGVATTANVTYTYDNSQSSTTKGLLLSVSVGSGYSESYSYDSFKRVQSVTRTIDGHNYTTSYQFNTINQTTRVTYPSGRVVNASYDGSARLASLANSGGPSYISSMAYDVNGNPTGWILGNGVHEGFSYDANRLQPTLHTAGTTAPYTNLMNIGYGYQAAAGQMGAGSTAGNAGQLISISGAISGTTESASYTWDNLGRLVTSNQSSNGSAAQRRFAYDRWGNRTAVWDAVSGGNQIQAVSLEQSGGAPTNRISALSVPGWYGTYSYEAAGNVIWDGVHSYQYDAQNRLVAVDNGSTASYAYDHQNRRIKKLVGTTSTHYVWEGSRVLAEHDGNSGAQILDYVYAGGKLVAKGSGSTPGGNTTYFLSDRMSERVAMDASGSVIGRQAHLPFGEDFGESGTQEKHHFTTYERDSETGNDYAVNRGYAPSAGRFLSADPYTPSGSSEDPRSWNRYSYTRNVVINRGDPLGLADGPIEGGCQPNAGGSYPGKCLCIVVPEACNRRFGPPNVDGNEAGPGGGNLLPNSKLSCNGGCRYAYLPESASTADLSAWVETSAALKEVEADFVATPRGVVKIPNGCWCNLTCVESYRIDCSCILPRSLIPFVNVEPRIMREKNWGKDLTNPSARFDWIGTGTPYARHHEGFLTVPPGGLPVPLPIGDFWSFY